MQAVQLCSNKILQLCAKFGALGQRVTIIAISHPTNPPVVNWECQLTEVDLYDGCKAVVFDSTVDSAMTFSLQDDEG